MVILERDWTVFKYRVAYFPAAQNLADLVLGLSLNSLLRIRQSPAASFEEHPHLLKHSMFKTICIDLGRDPAALKGAMDSTTRRWLNKGEKMSDRTRIALNDKSTYSDFLDLYNRFARAHAHSGPLSPHGLNRFTESSDLFMIYLDGRPVCGHVWLRDQPGRRMRLLFSASSRLEGKDDAAISGALNRVLHWHEMQLYKGQGFELYDLGGFEHDDDVNSSLTRFKLSLGADIREENDYVFGRGLAKLAFSMYSATPQLSSILRGRLPA